MMKIYLNILGRIVALAGLWVAGGFMIGAALEMIGFDSYPLRTIIAALNLILGMIIFKGATSYRFVDQAFFKGAKPYEPGYSVVGCLWLLPVLVVIVGASMWFWSLVLHLVFRE